MSAARNVESIIERQARFWEMQRLMAEQGGEAARRAMAHLHQGPWLSVSRQPGTACDEVISGVADVLGWQVFDREILAEIAKNTQTREAVLAHLDGRAVVAFNEFMAKILVPDLPDQAEFLRQLTEVIWGLARRGRAIIVGRGGNWFLDPEFGLRVRFVAPLDERVPRFARQLGIATDAAERQLRDAERQQMEFVRQAFGRQIDDPAGYDLVLNAGGLDTAASIEVVVTALQHKLDAVPRRSANPGSG